MHIIQEEIGLSKIKKDVKSDNLVVFTIDPLPSGYGMTLGNAFRRVLLSSLPGTAITAIKIEGAPHEYTTLSGVRDSVLDIILNLKVIYLKKHSKEKEIVKYEISIIEGAVLFVIQAIGKDATPAEISRWMLREHNSISALLLRMEGKGLIKRTKNLKWKNMVRVSITKKGKQAYLRWEKFQESNHLLSVLSETERLQLNATLNKLRDTALQACGIEYKPPFP